MTTGQVRADADWLALREPVDAGSRSGSLVDEVRGHLPTEGVLRVHDLGCGTGSMARWLAPRLEGPQHWVMHDHDAALLARVPDQPPGAARDGSPVSVETRRDDITALSPTDLAGAGLVTASALLDMLTRPELDRLVAACCGPGCAVLIALTVTGDVALDPPDRLDDRIGAAFNAHQRRPSGGTPRLGPDAVEATVETLASLGREVVQRPSPWRLGPDRAGLLAAWLTGWVGAACEQEPGLVPAARAYSRARLTQAAAGELSVTVDHLDLLARPG